MRLMGCGLHEANNTELGTLMRHLEYDIIERQIEAKKQSDGHQ